MFPRVVRAAVLCAAFAATMLAVMTLTRPAHAAPAPFCDDRGATALAAPPALEAPDVAIRRVRVTGCNLDFDVLMASLSPWHGKASATADAPGPVGLIAAQVTAPSDSTPLLATEPPGRPCVGARGRVERPPRG